MAVASELVELGSGEEPTMGCVELMREAAMCLTFTGNSSSEGTTLDSCEWWIS